MFGVSIALLTGREETKQYLTEVRTAADSEKNAFGFLPYAAYEEFSYQDRIIIAVDNITKAMLGYVLYGGAMPQGRIFQAWAKSNKRMTGVGRSLIEVVVSRLEAQGYLSLRADVADDLSAANSFYARLGFNTVRTKPAKTRGRSINIRVRELSTPSLLELAIDRDEPKVGLPCDFATIARTPLYLIDINVLFDAIKRRTRALQAGRVIAAGLENDVKLAVSSEFTVELERHEVVGEPDPILELARALPRVPLPSRDKMERYSRQLTAIIFPERSRAGKLTLQDISDVRHVATAIEECASGFITSEKAILRASANLKREFGIEVISPEAFGIGDESAEDLRKSLSIGSGASSIEAGLIDDRQRARVEEFLRRYGRSERDIRLLLAAGTSALPRRRYYVARSDCIIAFGAWDAPGLSSQARELVAYVDESNPAAAGAADYIIRRAVKDVRQIRPITYNFIVPEGQTTLRRIAYSHGFFSAGASSPRSRALHKVAVGAIVIPASWTGVVNSLQTAVGLNLPRVPPAFTGSGLLIQIANRENGPIDMPIAELERLLSPVIFVLPDRPGVMLPIKPGYAEELFHGTEQPSFLPDRSVLLRSNRGYIGGAATFGTIPDGGLAVFYESGARTGRSAAIAVARISRKFLAVKDNAAKLSAQKGVLDPAAIQKMGAGKKVAVTEFEDLMLFSKPVPLHRLREIGCVDGANFVTARQLSPEHIVEIVKAGEPSA